MMTQGVTRPYYTLLLLVLVVISYRVPEVMAIIACIVGVFYICELCFRVSIIKLEIAFVDPDNRIEKDIRQIKKMAVFRRQLKLQLQLQQLQQQQQQVSQEGRKFRQQQQQQQEVPQEGRGLKLSDIVSCLQDNVDNFSCARCWVGHFWDMNWKNRYIKLSGSVWRRVSNNEGNKNLVVTILAAVDGVHKLPTSSSPEEIEIALQQMAFIGGSNIKSLDVFCTHGGIKL